MKQANGRMLVGAFGDAANVYADTLRGHQIQCSRIDRNFYARNANVGKIKYPSVISINGRHIMLNGVLVPKHGTLGGIVNGPSASIETQLAGDPGEIPKQFVNGAYVGVICDGDSLFIFNDFMGLLPVYYSTVRRTLIFSTSIRLLARLLGVGWEVSGVAEFLRLGSMYSNRTILKGVYSLPPAALLRYRNGELSIRHYSTFPEGGEKREPLKRATTEVHAEFRTAVGKVYSDRLRYCLSLTGGMDSRMIFLEWPDRANLLTETAGSGTSDYLKARTLVDLYGNPRLHELERKYDDKYLDGIVKYYDLCDNPTRLAAHYNYHHLKWKQDRGADVHLSGIGGELLDGESLYVKRTPLYVLREGLTPYTYHPIKDTSKPGLIGTVLYAQYKDHLVCAVSPDLMALKDDPCTNVARELDSYIGHPLFAETYVERFRTFVLANACFFPLSFVGSGDFQIFPFNDVNLIRKVTALHPATRELRRLSLAMLKGYRMARDIPIDTTHLKVTSPYCAHKAFRVLRMVLNIGFHKKVPLLQRGNPPDFRKAKYFDHSQAAYRAYVNSVILDCSFYDRARVKRYLGEIGGLSNSNFYTLHNQAANVALLFRLAVAEQKLFDNRPLTQGEI